VPRIPALLLAAIHPSAWKVNSAKFAPTTAAGKIFTVFYIFAGIGIIVGFVNAVARASDGPRLG
jgi:hypothetical protein